MYQNPDTKVVIPVSIKTLLGVDTDTNGKTASQQRRRFNKAARTMLPVLVAVKDRVRSRWSVLPYHREPEYLAVLGLADEMVNAVFDDTDLTDARAAGLLGAVFAFIRSTYQTEPPTDWEEA